MALSIADKIKSGLLLLQWRRCRSKSSLFGRSVSLSTSSCRSSLNGSSHSSSYSSSGSWDCSDWNGYSSDEEEHEGCCCVSAAPEDVPEGFLPVYVGEERRRCVINARHLAHPWFKALLEKAAEEFGFDHKEGLRLPCEVMAFEIMVEKLDKSES